MSDTDEKEKGFDYYRTDEQLIAYRNLPAEEKIRWLEEMFEFNRLVAESNPRIAAIQQKFRRGEM